MTPLYMVLLFTLDYKSSLSIATVVAFYKSQIASPQNGQSRNLTYGKNGVD